jgi:cytochrome b561
VAVRNDASGYGAIARGLHWLTALLVAGLWIAGTVMVDLTDLGLKFALYQWHKSFGFVVLALTAIRLLWRQLDPPPPAPPMPAWQRRAAAASHALLYLLLLAIPLSGFLMVSTAPIAIPTVLFGVVPVPHPLAPDELLFTLFRQVHESLTTLLLVLVGVHAAAALKHHLVDRDAVLRRMLVQRP